ncbi:MAG TPA: hypothetical protein VHB25_21770 [Gemmatimonadaceae bacterium]|nr:hypothetical protein [Gemmatimonadaceae bacterium]
MADTPARRPPNADRRRLVAAFTERLGLKATAVLLAVVLWFVVNAKEPQIEIVPVEFRPVLDSSLVLRDPPPQLHALVAGSPKELIKLSSNSPVVRRQITSDSPDTVVLDLRPDDVALPPGVDAVVRDLEPRSVTLRFESTWSRKVPVHSALTIVPMPLPGPIETRFDPESVVVSGPRHLVLRILSVRTTKTTVTFPDSLPHLVDIDTTGFGQAVRVRPTQVKVQLIQMPNP